MVFEIADVFDHDDVPVAHGPRQHRHARIPIAVVAWLLAEPAEKEQSEDAQQQRKGLPQRLPHGKQGHDAASPADREPPAPCSRLTNIEIDRAGHPERDRGGNRDDEYGNHVLQDAYHGSSGPPSGWIMAEKRSTRRLRPIPLP